jgi:hypothetical protein
MTNLADKQIVASQRHCFYTRATKSHRSLTRARDSLDCQFKCTCGYACSCQSVVTDACQFLQSTSHACSPQKPLICLNTRLMLALVV